MQSSVVVAACVALLPTVLVGCSSSPSGASPAASATATPPVTSAPVVASAPPVSTFVAPPPASVVLPSGLTAPMSFSSLVKTCDPAVVTVFSIKEERGRSGRRRTVMEGLGTGFLYDPQGYIITNEHVISEATNVTVRLADERRVPAKIVGRDPQTDVAVLKIDVAGLSALPLGDSDALDVGDWVVAIGNPFGLSHTVSAGILSAKGRSREDLADLDKTGRGYFNFLQTDAAINQGNSGGPLINLHGQVVGINTAIRANANNIGFAIPINMVKSLIPMLVRDGKVTRSAIGITVGGVTEDDVERLKRSNRKGALVRGVQPGGPGDKAGLAVDDVIMAFNGVEIVDPEALRWQASIAGVGAQATVKVARGERVFDLKVTLGALPDDIPDDRPRPPEAGIRELLRT
ncbi:MAG: trypsin-like peptidase domain-containing protein [Polyangiaceae bacterium]